LHPKIIHGSLINHTCTKIIPDIYEINYRQNKKGHLSNIIPGQGKLIPLHQKNNSWQLITHMYKITPDIYDINHKQKRQHVKNNSRYTKLIAPQGKIIPLHPKIILGTLINHTYTKIIPDIYDIYYRQKATCQK